MIKMDKGISIIIPTFNRFSILQNTLSGFLAQVHYNHSFEVILVDNGSSENIEQLIIFFKDYFPIRIIKRFLKFNHFKPGSARNIGARYAIFNKLIFLDSDCIPSRTFLAAHWDVLSVNSQNIITIGHRIFIESERISYPLIANYPTFLKNIKLSKT